MKVPQHAVTLAQALVQERARKKILMSIADASRGLSPMPEYLLAAHRRQSSPLSDRACATGL